MDLTAIDLAGRILFFAASGAVVVILLRDLAYRLFFTYPATSISGRYAAHIESANIPRWVAPLTAGRLGKKDVIFVGNSHVMDAIDPTIIEKQTGLSGFNLALYGHCSFNLLLLLIRYQHYPRHVVIDVSAKYSMAAKGQYFEDHFEAWVNPSPQRQAANKRQEYIDRAHAVLPSLFAPDPYRGMIRRTLEKLRKYREKKYMYLGRYSPFRPFTSYQFQLDKTTNHRAVHKERPKSKYELAYEEYLLQMSLEGLPRFCIPGSLRYRQTLVYNEAVIRLLRARGVKVTIMRLPLDRRIISREERVAGQYFKDIQALCQRQGVRYLDFNGPETAKLHKHYEFYNDGHHVYQHTAEKVSRYLGRMLVDQDRQEADGQNTGEPKAGGQAA